MRHSAIFLCLSLAGCPAFTSGVPRPPSYDEECQPTDPFYFELAATTEDMAKPGEIPEDPVEAYNKAKEILDSRGVQIIPKAEGIEDWSRFNTTFPESVYVSKRYPTYDEAKKAAILWHEIVHLREYDRHGVAKFFTIYAFAEGRWALEVQAYRESFRIKRMWGEDEESIQAAMQPRIELIYEGYKLDQMPKQCAVQAAVEIWKRDAL